MPQRLLLTGRPGIGKTTAVIRTVERLREAGVPVAGFVTEEVRDDGGARVGFDLVLLEGSTRASLARVGLDSEVTVGRYGVDVEAVRSVGLPALQQPDVHVTVIDEIAPMELACPGFREAVEAVLASDRSLLATVHARGGAWIRERRDTRVIEVTRANRDRLPGDLATRLSP